MTARRSRSRAAIAGALVVAIAAPIRGSPRAIRVMSRQPPAASAGRLGPVGSRGGSPAVPRRPRRARSSDDERQVADPGDGRVVVRRPSSSTGRAPHARASDATTAVVGWPAWPPGRGPMAARRRGRRSPRRTRSPRDRPSGGRPRTRRPSACARSPIAPFVLATSVTMAPVAQARPARSRRAVEQREALGRRRREDDQVGASDRVAPASPASRLDHAVGEGRRRAAARRAPCDDVPAARGRLEPQGARDRSADQAEPEEGDAHGPDRLRRPAGRSVDPAGVVVAGRRRTSLRRVVAAAPVGRSARSSSPSGGPGSSGGFCRRFCRRRSVSRRSSLSEAPQRGQRRSSAKSDSSGATV